MYLRFSTTKWDPESTRNLGILVAAHDLRDDGDITRDEHEILRKTLKWFNENVTVPKILKDTDHRRAISWFKSSATEPVQKMWELVEILRHHDVNIDVHKTNNPGIVIYEDEWQVVAKPEKGSKVPW
jgi:hypothetical protein